MRWGSARATAATRCSAARIGGAHAAQNENIGGGLDIGRVGAPQVGTTTTLEGVEFNNLRVGGAGGAGTVGCATVAPKRATTAWRQASSRWLWPRKNSALCLTSARCTVPMVAAQRLVASLRFCTSLPSWPATRRIGRGSKLASIGRAGGCARRSFRAVFSIGGRESRPKQAPQEPIFSHTPTPNISMGAACRLRRHASDVSVVCKAQRLRSIWVAK